MSETEYLIVGNLARVREAHSILCNVIGGYGCTAAEVEQIKFALYRLQEKLSEQVETVEDECAHSP